MDNVIAIAKLLSAQFEVHEVLRYIEGLPPKVEQIQPVVRQQDAALHPDKHGRSAAGNPDGHHWTEAFEGFLKEQLELAEMAHRRNPCGPTSVRPRTLAMVMDAFQFHKGQGAA